MKTKIFILNALMTALLFGAASFLPASDSCMTAECHTDMKKMNLHPPAADDCTLCHEEKGKHKFELVGQVEICFECHDDNRKKKNVHGAIEGGECIACHNPHGGKHDNFLKAERLDTLCFECHEKEPMGKKVVHGPVGAGECNLCHLPHSSDHASLLMVEKEKLCIQCHDDKDFSVPDKGIHVHSVMEEGCGSCHDPHSSDHALQLIAAPADICAQCHDDKVEEAANAKFKHPIVQQKKKCLNCHEAHAGKGDANLKDEPTAMCLKCHNKPLSNASLAGYNIKTIMEKKANKHAPTEESCANCHNPHGSDYFRILKSAYPEKFYTEFDGDKYELCFQCHDASLVTAEKTLDDTNFRDGTRNLHFVHVNQKKGRTCRACHEVHGSDHKRLIRKHSPFGKWKLPLNFTKTPSGGTCTPGCHQKLTYDNTKLK